MNEEQKKRYLEKYYQAKQKGEKFWPDVIYSDLLVSFAIFLLLIGLAIFIGVASEPKADPSDSAYIPRPEWYFLFLFQLLKYFPGRLEWVGTTIIPTIAVLALFILPFYDRSPFRYWSKRKIAVSIMTIVVVGMVALTIIAMVTTPPQTETGTIANTIGQKVSAGQDLYSLNCVQCHGADGEGGEIKGVQGLEGFKMKAIKSQDEMYTRNDDTLASIIAFGQPSLGMQPFGRAYGGQLSPGDIDAIVTFIRYSWDDREQLPKEVVEAGKIPTLAPNEVPSYDVYIVPVFKRYCVSCHRAGIKNNNYLMDNYDKVMKSGDHAPNIIPGDLNSNLIRMLHRETIPAGGPMPPTKPLPDDLIKLIERWVTGGALQTAKEAAAATSSTAPPSTQAGTPAPPAVSTPTPKP